MRFTFWVCASVFAPLLSLLLLLIPGFFALPFWVALSSVVASAIAIFLFCFEMASVSYMEGQ